METKIRIVNDKTTSNNENTVYKPTNLITDKYHVVGGDKKKTKLDE